ncbi:hypothetical protein PQ465_07265 [Sphingobacterium oryzagri]|uniref:Uncharacterized protein n=1 Tax=Sphingobacterium oryzagri TaxID=3025669 RepID=A0ABY7WS86_9SPHI|nr:hypothetical protein [Sphingobacterium sp. KACC 22765]WDF70169.1 hypothetical protein PQ465_07265 [Sphingobacterium sp. KACC 22765]
MEVSEESLAKRYESLTNDELFELLDNKFEYTDLAVKTAFSELSKRDVSEEDIKRYKTKLINKVADDFSKLVYYDLKTYQKILYYIFWLPIFNFAFKMNYREKGEYLKIKQANYYTTLGFLCLFPTVAISVSFEFDEISTLFLWLSCLLPTYAFDDFLNRNVIIKKIYRRFAEDKKDR